MLVIKFDIDSQLALFALTLPCIVLKVHSSYAPIISVVSQYALGIIIVIKIVLVQAS